MPPLAALPVLPLGWLACTDAMRMESSAAGMATTEGRSVCVRDVVAGGGFEDAAPAIGLTTEGEYTLPRAVTDGVALELESGRP